ncbi:alpha/beta hydrolase [Candidatus Lokiarchaeum ossiferum]|uniref:alpha/beta hydrolase n=1 Tax=Candidatus Lokiarchaeum ossiferum TaxID=2951803 RepID=UPI00352CA9C6
MLKKIQVSRSIDGFLHATIYTTERDPSITPIVILCHGFTGDQTEWGRFEKTATVLNQNGYDAITFDFSGSGKNIREPITLSKQSQDLKDIYNYLKEKGYVKINILGLSFGGLTALVTQIPDIASYIFWAPAFYIFRLIPKFHKFLLKLAYIFKRPPIKRESLNNHPVLMDYTFISDKKMKNPNKYLENMEVPSIIIHGNKDTTIYPKVIIEAFQHMPAKLKKKRVEIEGTGHNFDGKYLDLFIEHSINWLNEWNKK